MLAAEAPGLETGPMENPVEQLAKISLERSGWREVWTICNTSKRTHHSSEDASSQTPPLSTILRIAASISSVAKTKLTYD
jgi:hypothetical protein